MDPRDLAIRLATAPGDVELVELLAKGQESKRLLQLLALAKKTSPDQISVLSRVQGAAPQALRTVLRDPSAITHAGHHSGPITLAAAAVAQVPACVRVTVCDGQVSLPTLGGIRVPPLDTAGPPDDLTIEVSANNGQVRLGLSTPDGTVVITEQDRAATPSWEPLTRIVTGTAAVLDVTLTTTGPLRDIYAMPAGFHGPPADEWRPVIEAGWALLEAELPDYAAAVAAGVRTLVPVPPHPNGGNASCTVDGTFGAVFLSFPPDPESFAVALVHEFQHAKLSAALDITPLHTAGDEAIYFAPWREDRRPLTALLHGIYAHLGVAQFWGTHRYRALDRVLFAHVEFARWREDSWRACQGILDDPALTDTGKLFVAALAAELERLRGAGVPREATDIAARMALDAAVCWRLRHLPADPASAAELAAASILQTTSNPAPVNTVVEHTPRAQPSARVRTGLTYRRITDACRPEPPVAEADHLYGRGHFEAAADAYQKRIRQDPGDLDAWAGLAVSVPPQDPDHAALHRIPEVVAETYGQAHVLGLAPQSPLHLVRWLTRQLPADHVTAVAAGVPE